MTQLHEAVLSNDVKRVRNLLAKGADINGKEPISDETPLGSLAAQDILGFFSTSSLTMSQTVRMAKILVQAGADVNSVNYKGDTPLHNAATFHNIPMIEFLISAGANVNSSNGNKWTPLLKITGQFHSGYGSERLDGIFEVIKILLENKADVNVTNNIGMTPLLYSVFHNYDFITKLLIDYGADVNLVLMDGSVPLHWACKMLNKKSIKLLLENGAKLNALDEKGYTPFMYALNDSTNTENNTRREREQIKTLKFLLKKNSDVNTVDSKGNNILTINSELDNECFKIILQHLAKMDVLNVSINPSILKTLASHKSYNNYFAKCKKELLEAKSTIIQEHFIVTYFDLLGNNKRKLMNYASNKELIEHFQKSNYQKKYIIFAPYMKENVEKAIKRSKLHNDAFKTLKECLPKDSTDLIVKKIINFFDKCDLQKLLE